MGAQVAGKATTGDAAADGHVVGYGGIGYRSYVLNSLLLVYILNFVDRGLLSVVAGPLKGEIGITDTWWGLLTGFGFAFLYTIVGIPLARISETRNRVWIIAICLVIWSGFTALCGLARDLSIWGITISGFAFLLACRIGVGIGEAGCTPPANSLIADYYPPKRRSTALGYYAMGVPLGTMLANMIGGPVADNFGWRNAFYILGLPGIAVAILLVMTVREPPRGYSDPPSVTKTSRATWGETLTVLFSKPSFWWMAGATTIAAFCGYAIANFQSLYIQRTFSLTAGQAALWFNAPSYAAGAVGTMLTGWLAERIGARSVSAIAWLPAIGLLVCVPFYLWAFTTSSMVWCLVGLASGHFIKYGYLAAQYTIGQGVVGLRMRATATAILLFVINFLGYGLGPPFAGVLSDFFFNSDLATQGMTGVVNRASCDAALQAVVTAGRKTPELPIADVLATLKAPMSAESYGFCQQANADSTRYSMLTISSIYALGAVCFVFCMFGLKRDMVAK